MVKRKSGTSNMKLIKLLTQVVIEARIEKNVEVEILAYRILYKLSGGQADKLLADCKPRRNNKIK